MKKNNSDFELMKKLEDMLNNMQELQYQEFVEKCYIKSDIETFTHELSNMKPEINIINNREPDERESRIIELWGKFQILKVLFETKKFMNSKTDIIAISDLLLDMAKECREIGEL